MFKKGIKQFLSGLLIIVLVITNTPTEGLAEGNNETVHQSNQVDFIVSGSVYTITSKQSKKVIEVSEGNYNNGAVLQQWNYGEGENQQWFF